MQLPQILSNPTTIYVIVFAVIVAVITAYFVWSSYNSNTSYNANRENNKETNSTDKVAHLMLFYADWCPHCKTAKPEWNALKDEYDGKTINGYVVVFEEYNCTENSSEIEELMNKYGVEGYPTVKLIKDGQVIEYDAKPTKDTMEKFLTTVL